MRITKNYRGGALLSQSSPDPNCGQNGGAAWLEASL